MMKLIFVGLRRIIVAHDHNTTALHTFALKLVQEDRAVSARTGLPRLGYYLLVDPNGTEIARFT